MALGLDKQKYAEFELERELGRGASARIYLARVPGTGEQVSLKVFHPGLFKDPNAAIRIRREFKALTRLAHPNIVPVRALLTEVDPPAIVMDYIDGENLEAFQMRLPYLLPEVSVLIVMQILSALETAHEQGVVHRDLKPENVLVRRDGTVFVTDFGLAKFLDASTNITQPNHIVGSADYMSPEQASGEALTASSDLFSVASILYFLTTGTRPFARETLLATLGAIRTDAPEAPERRNPKISGALSRILQRALEKDPAARYATAGELRAALGGYLSGIGLGAASFRLSAWLEDPSGTTNAMVRLAAETLTQRAELAAKERRWSDLLELVAHLSLKAPESGAVARLMSARRRSRRPGPRAFRAAAAVVVVVVLLFGLQRFRATGDSPPAHAAPIAAAPAPAPISPPSEAPRPATIASSSGTQPAPARPAPPAVPRETLGEVRFRVARGTLISWDGKQVDPRRPLKRVALGKHVLVLTLKGYEPIRRVIEVTGDEPVEINAQ